MAVVFHSGNSGENVTASFWRTPSEKVVIAYAADTQLPSLLWIVTPSWEYVILVICVFRCSRGSSSSRNLDAMPLMIVLKPRLSVTKLSSSLKVLEVKLSEAQPKTRELSRGV